jgi:hypothetical protein
VRFDVNEAADLPECLYRLGGEFLLDEDDGVIVVAIAQMQRVRPVASEFGLGVDAVFQGVATDLLFSRLGD